MYVACSIGEFLILFAFVNEKSWKRNSVEAVFSFLIFWYSVAMEVVFWKAYFLCLFKRLLRNLIKRYDELLGHDREERTRSIYFTMPFTVLFACATALLHWFMLAILGFQIYSDNFFFLKMKKPQIVMISSMMVTLLLMR